MPISLLKYIIKGDKTSDNFLKIMPSDTLIRDIDSFYISNCKGIIAKQLIFNDGLPAIVFTSDSNSNLRMSVDGEIAELCGGWISGGITKNIYIDNTSNVDYLFIVRFVPAAFYRFFELDTKIFKRIHIGAIEDILGEKGVELKSLFYGVNSIDDRVAQIESYIKRLDYSNYPIALLDEAINFIKKRKGNTSVIEVSNKIGVNYKWLERNFSNKIGITPKEYVVIQRFIHAYFDFTENTNKDYLSLAIQNGYYDQSHFFREFKSFVDISPLKYTNRTSCH